MSKQPSITVGVLRSKKISFILFGDFTLNDKSHNIHGRCSAEFQDGKIIFIHERRKIELKDEFELRPHHPHDEYFQIKDVVIGIDFHWERKEKQSFRGTLKIKADTDALWAINVVPLEEYLKSVISSEMSPKSSIGLLKAHAVISRSWLLAQIEKTKELKSAPAVYSAQKISDTELIRWYDREDHALFDVCADDHCQRYQGITKIHSGNAVKSVEETAGLVLVHDGKICDARFSKSCGGISESFENVWEEKHFDYLVPVIDYKFPPDDLELPLDTEAKSVAWIEASPQAFCNTSDKKILEQVLQDYDYATKDFFRWKVDFTQDELKELIKKKTGIDFGFIIDMEALQRGDSGRIIRMKITGTAKTLVIGKELVIRKALSASHLYSSAFVVKKSDIVEGIPQKFELIGAGWGHGVGLCQIGAAVMAEKGYTFDEILRFYYPNALLELSY